MSITAEVATREATSIATDDYEMAVVVWRWKFQGGNNHEDAHASVSKTTHYKGVVNPSKIIAEEMTRIGLSLHRIQCFNIVKDASATRHILQWQFEIS